MTGIGFQRYYIFLAVLSFLTGCTLTSREIEPDLPEGQIEGQSTVAYHANRIPVVVNNTSDFCLFCGGRDYPVMIDRSLDGRLILHASDADNGTTGTLSHGLRLGIAAFKGRGTYAIDPAITAYSTQLDGSNSPARNYQLVSQAENRFTVTASDTTQRILRGTFSLTVIDPASGQTVAITDGRFDVKGY